MLTYPREECLRDKLGVSKVDCCAMPHVPFQQQRLQ
jgi:hypothetical protein